jgi:hypothetical protein
LPRFADLALAAGEITEITPFVLHKEKTEPPRHFSLSEAQKKAPAHFGNLPTGGFLEQ